MKSYREELWVETKSRRAYINITPQVEAAVKKSGVKEGLVLVNAMHITASVYVNDDESGVAVLCGSGVSKTQATKTIINKQIGRRNFIFIQERIP